ncbi:MAG: hypothetical protein ABI434_08345, partial [Burkholderiaceae bacterium]
MPNWKIRTLLVVLLLMLAGGACQSQDATAPMPSAFPAAQAQRGGTPSPYSPPIAVPSAAGQIEPLHLPSALISVTPSPVPTFAPSCDSAGCWGSDGTRYNTVGGSLVRPDGRNCQVVAGVV